MYAFVIHTRVKESYLPPNHEPSSEVDRSDHSASQRGVVVVLGGKVVCVTAPPEIALERSSPGMGIFVSLVHCPLTGTETALPHSLVLSRYPLRDKVGSY